MYLILPQQYSSKSQYLFELPKIDDFQDALEKTWDLVQPGGIVVIDDFFHKVQGPARGWLVTCCGWSWLV